MKKPSKPPEIWTLWDRDITLQADKLIEYQDVSQVRTARVQQVRVLSVPPHTQVIDVKLYGPLTSRDGRRERWKTGAHGPTGAGALHARRAITTSSQSVDLALVTTRPGESLSDRQ